MKTRQINPSRDCKRHPDNGGTCTHAYICNFIRRMEQEEPDDKQLLDWIRFGVCRLCGFFRCLTKRAQRQACHRRIKRAIKRKLRKA